jgi:hypothetical protein
MRFLFCALLVLASPSAFGQAAPPAPPAPEETPKRPSWKTKLAFEGQVDTSYRIGRTTEGVWLNVVDVRGLARLHVIDSQSSSHAFGVRGRFEQWFGVSPAPRRYLFGALWDAGMRRNWTDVGFRRPEGYGFRGVDFDVGILVGVDYSRAESLSFNSKPRDGVRMSMDLRMGVAVLSLEPGGALTANFDPDRPLDAEGWFKLGIMRPVSPLSGHIGYYYHVTGRFETHFFTVGLRVRF